jgi:CSLREA domain-containing protein
MTTIARLLLIGAFALSFAVAASAATFVVNSTADLHDVSPGNGVCLDSAGRCSLRAAIDETNSLAGADSITLPAGAYTVTHTDDPFAPVGSLTINGAGAGSTFIQGALAANLTNSSVLSTNSAILTINGVTIRYGDTYLTAGGGIRADSSVVTLNNCVVRDNQLRHSLHFHSWGGGIGVFNSTLVLTNTTVTNNKLLVGNINTPENSWGGGIYGLDSYVTLNNSLVSNNQIVDLYQNNYPSYGAGIALQGTSNFSAVGSQISSNGGAFSGAAATVRGAGIAVVTTAGNTVFNLANSTVTGSSANGVGGSYGGGIYLETAGTATISSSIDKSTISGNQITDPYGYGGGLFIYANGGAVNQNLTNSTISGNYCAGYAGGVFMDNNGSSASTGNATFNYTNDTISGNVAGQDGGGIYFYKLNSLATTFVLNLNFVTVANNKANNDNLGTNGGGGIMEVGNTVNLKNSVIATTYVGSGGLGFDLRGGFYSQGYNQIGIADLFTLYNSNATDGFGIPTLGPLQNNSGPTFTQLPGFGPLVDQIPYGVNGCGTTVNADQRGLGRPAYSKCDKGAVEWWYAN